MPCFKKPELTIFFVALLLNISAFGQEYKDMMSDNEVNFYDVVEAAEKYFTENDKGKGSGYKGFQRWVADNEFKYFPDGDRSTVDPFLVSKAYQKLSGSAGHVFSKGFNGWNELGPVEPGQITGHYAFGMGRIRTFYVDPTNTNTLYIGSRTGGFWKSLDGGDTWHGGSTDFLPACGVNTLAVSPTNSDSILINANNSTNHYSHGIYRSIDGGDTWTESNFNPTNLGWGGLGSTGQIYKIKYHPTIPDLIFVGTRSGLYRSKDNLASWTVPVNNDDFTDIDFHPTDPAIVYAYANNNANVVYTSQDTGKTFSTTTIPGSSGGKGTVQVSAACPDCVYYLSSDGYWKSTDKGQTFVLISTPGISNAGFAVNDLDDSKILGGYVDAMFSYDGGSTFEQVTYWSLGNTNGAGSGHQQSYLNSTDYIHADLQAAECYNGVFYAVTDGFLVKSDDNGVSWEILSEKIGIRMNYNLGVSQSNHYRTICGSQDNGTSVLTENGWVEMYGADGMEGLVHPLNDDWMVGSWQYGGRIRTFNAGQSLSIIEPNGQDGYWIAPLFSDPNNQMHLYSLGEYVYHSEKFGDDWVQRGTPSFSGTIRFASIAENNSNRIVACSGADIELSEDGGNTWSSIRGSLPNYSITDVVFDPNDDNTILVSYGRYQDDDKKVYITHDAGATWENITYNLGAMPVRSVVVDHSNASNIYLGTEIGVYVKSMDGVSWELFNDKLPNTSIKEMEVVWGTNTLRATTWGRGLWEYDLKDRGDFPDILTTSTTDKPTFSLPKEGVDQYVTSQIDYNGTVTKAWVAWSLNNQDFDQTINMSLVSGNEWKSDAPFTGHPVGSDIFFKVFAVGANNDTSETYKFQFTIQPFEYCEALGSNDGSNLRIRNVTVANIDNDSENDTYSYYENLVVELERGENYTISMLGSTSWGNNDYAAWIDFNGDANFSEEEAVLFDVDAGSTTAQASFTVPQSALLNDTLRLRTRLAYWGVSPSPCGTTLGEVEDYPVVITGCESILTSLSKDTCDAYFWSNTGETYTTSGVYRDTLSTAEMCDSIVELTLTIAEPFEETEEVATCSNYTWDINDVEYTESGTYTEVFTSQFGCDSTYHLVLDISDEIRVEEIVLACDSFYWATADSTYFESGTFRDTLQSVDLCDSINELVLTIDTVPVFEIEETACDSFYWETNDQIYYEDGVFFDTIARPERCDSIVQLDLTILSGFETEVEDTACFTYFWDINNETYSETGTYIGVTQAQNGCDSTITLQLVIDTVNTEVEVSNPDLIAGDGNETYQWVDCLADFTELAGETSQTFTADANGEYAVVVTNGNCSDTSDCVIVNWIGIEENWSSRLHVYPNPSSGELTIEFKGAAQDVELVVFDVLGKTILQDKVSNKQQLSYQLDVLPGQYVLNLKMEDEVFQKVWIVIP